MTEYDKIMEEGSKLLAEGNDGSDEQTMRRLQLLDRALDEMSRLWESIPKKNSLK
jgi:hypothetical protein